METFATARAEEQVERLLDYAAFPGAGLLIDPFGEVILERGEIGEIDAQRLAELASILTPSECDCVPLDPDVLLLAGVPREHYGLLVGLRAGYRVCIVVPHAVAAANVQPRLIEVRDRLVAMMRPFVPGTGGAPPDDAAPSTASALWVFAMPRPDRG